MKQHVKTVRTVRVRSARIPDISWVALLNEVGPLVESVPPGIAGELKAAEERLMNAVAEYEAATAYLAGEAGECLKTVRELWSQEEIAAAQDGCYLIDGERFRVEEYTFTTSAREVKS